MNTISPRIGQAAVASIHGHFPNAKVIGIKTTRIWQGDDKVSVNGTVFRVVSANSVLQIRELLLTVEEDLPLVILTSLPESELGNDLLARFAKRRLWSIKPWPIIADLFQAKDVAPSLQNKKWLAEGLLERLAPQNFPPVASGMVDEDTVWRIVLNLYLDIEQARPDARDLLEWTLQENTAEKFLALNSEMKEGIYNWLKQSAGRLGELILSTVEAGYSKDVMAIGLVLQVVLGQSNNQDLRDAAIRLERFIGSKFDESLANQWANFAGSLLRKLQKNEKTSLVIKILRRSDEILEELGISNLAYLSNYSPKGFEIRFEQYAHTLQGLLKSSSVSFTEKILEKFLSIKEHWQNELNKEDKDRVLRVEMSLRLVNWLANANETQEYSNFQEVADKYLSELSFVDFARQSLYQGDKQESLSTVYNQLLKIVKEKREAFNRRFAELLANWTEFSSSANKLLKVEEILKQVVAPVAQSSSVLLIVLDGMSYAVFHELLEDILDDKWGWGLLCPEPSKNQQESNWPRAVISTLPSITESSRTSLLCGQLLTGISTDEVKGFKTSSDLVKVSKANHLPLLFHKGTLTEDGNGKELAKEVRKEIVKQERKIIGVVLNVIDDYLAKGEQIAVKWNLSSIPLLAQLLEIARDTGRVVILTSDHGHILERDMIYRKGEQGERYRTDDNTLMADEIRISGSRVLTVANHTLIFPWSESIRYTIKKCGYHGGVTPQEMVIPLAVMSWNKKSVSNWKELARSKPLWWEFPERKSESNHIPETINKKKSKKTQQDDGLPLFDMVEEDGSSL